MSIFAKNKSVEFSRDYRQFFADQSTYSSATKGKVVIEVEINPDMGEYIDWSESRLVFDDAQDGGTVTTGKLSSWSAGSWIEDIQIKAYGQASLADQMNHYNGFQKMVNEREASKDYADTWGSVLEGAEDVTIDGSTSSDFERAHKIQTGVATFSGYYPAFAHRGFYITINMADAEERFELTSSTVTPVYTIKNLRLNAAIVQLKPEFHGKVLAQLASPEGINLDFVSHEAVFKSTDGTNETIAFAKAGHRLKALDCFQVVTASRGVTGKYWKMARNGITSYRYKIGGKFVDQEPTDVSYTDAENNKMARHVMNELRGLKKLSDMTIGNGNAFTPAKINSDRFVMSSRLDKNDDSDRFISSRDAKTEDVDLKIVTSGGAAAGTYLIKTEDRRVQIMSGSLVTEV